MDHRSNTQARYKLLIVALQGSKQVPPGLLKACKSQGGLANFSWPAGGIEPMALNTLKTKADEVIEEGGWKKLDAMRKSYLSAVKNNKRIPSIRVGFTENLKDQLKAAENSLEVERRYRVRLEVAYESLISILIKSSKNDPEISDLINRHVCGFSFKRLSLAEKL